MIKGTVRFKEENFPMAQDILKDTNYFIIRKDGISPGDLLVLASNLDKDAVKVFMKKFIEACLGTSETVFYSYIVDLIEVEGGGAFVTLSEEQKGVLVCCEADERTLHHEMGHVEQYRMLGHKTYMHIKDTFGKEKIVPYLDVHNIIVHENADFVIRCKPPQHLKGDYKESTLTTGGKVYVRVKYAGKPKKSKTSDEINGIKEKIKILSEDPRAERLPWFKKISERINEICSPIGNTDVKNEIENALLTLCAEMIKEGYAIFEELPKNLS